jgi:hypothetical protein
MAKSRKYSQRKKDWRKPYTKSKRFDKSCRCHGGCPYCEGNRTHKHKKQEKSAEDRRE